MSVINGRIGISEEFGGNSILMGSFKGKRTSEPFRINSMNYINRRNEFERINAEN